MRLLILGAGVHGQAVADLAAEEGVHAPVAFTDADPALRGQSRAGREEPSTAPEASSACTAT